MRRYAIVLLTMTGLTLGMARAPAGRAWAASEVATLKAVTVSTGPPCEELVLRVDGTYAYKTVQAAPDVLFIDLASAKIGGVPRSGSWSNPLMSGYKLLQYQDASGQSVVRVQVDTRRAQPFVIQRDSAALRLLFGKTASVSPAVVAPLLGAPATSPAVAAAYTAPPASVRGSVLVSNVTFDKRESGETFVDVSTSRTASYHVMTLKSPARLVVDFEDAQTASHQKSYAADTLVLRDVRIGQFREKTPPVVRVVADLNGDPAFDVHTTPGGVRIELRPRGMAKPALSAAKTTTPAPETRLPEAKLAPAASAATSPVTITKVPAPEPPTEVIDRKPVVTVPLRAAALDAAKPDVQSTLPPAGSSKQVAAAPLPTASSETPEALRAEQAARTLTTGKQQALPLAAQGTPPGSVNPPGEEKDKFTGEPISLNLKDVDLKDFFRLIHEISGLNIIVDPNVSGNVTLVLDSVPWDQALDIVLKNSRLGKTLEGNVLRIAKVETLTAEQEAATKLAAARQDAAPLVSVFQPVNYAKASTIAILLKSWAGGGALSRRGTVLVDDRANTLIISDIQSQIPIIQSIIAKLDKKAKQVSIEARVVLAKAGFTRALNAALSGAARTPQGSTLIGGATGSGAQITPSVTFPAPPGQTIEPTSAAGFGAVAISNASSRYLINAVLAASEERDESKTISRPTIVTQNNVQGMVMQGTQVPIQTNINNTIAVQYVNATLELTVTPQVTDDGNIFMIIKVTNASVGAVITGAGPNIDTQSATTQVMVPDGGTVVFGGITVTSRSKAATYVPWLGTIPILGHLFKSSNVKDADQELLFFVSPKVLAS
jgi:type IV pilus assembly protein PilQ